MSMWNFDTSNVEVMKTPFNIASDVCKELNEISRGKLIARVTEYSGKYKSSTTISYSAMLHSSLSNITDSYMPTIKDVPAFNVQDIMGDNASEDGFSNQFVYELYVTSRSTPKYKYRVLIMYYDINMYPVGLTIQRDIAKEIDFKSEGMEFESEAEFTKALGAIINSDTVKGILRNLLALN